MHFHIDRDVGNIISGWVILDNPSEIPEFSIIVSGQAVTTLRANILRADLRDLGLHSTGLVGFEIDDFIVPGLSSLERLSIQETTSGLVFYRREIATSYIEKKVLLCEVSCLPQIRHRETAKQFLLPHMMAEQYSLETITSILANNYTPSILVAGQLNWLRHGELAREKGFLCVAILRDPFTELAERLLFVRYILSKENIKGREFFLEHFSKTIKIVSNIDFDSEKSLLRAFRGLGVEERRILQSPMTYLFGATPDEILQRRNVSLALDNLAQFDAVGVRENYEGLRILIKDLAGSDILLDGFHEILPGTNELAASLRNVGVVSDLLDEDIALHSFVIEALESVAIPSDAAVESN